MTPKPTPCRIEDASYYYDRTEPDKRYRLLWECGVEEHIADLFGRAFRPDALVDATFGHVGHRDTGVAA